MERAGSALTQCAAEWESAQDRFDAAVRLAASAVAEEADHRGRVTSSVWAAAGAPVLDDGWRSPDRARARAMAQEAVDDAEVASRRCAAVLAAALPELGPSPPPPAASVAAVPVAAEKAWWDIGDDLTDEAADLWQGVQDAGDFVVDNGPEILDVAADTALMALGAAMMAGGVAGEFGGVALDATGVGAIVGVPVNVASAGLIVAGAGAAGAGAVQFGQDLNTLLNEAASPSGPSSGPPPTPGGGRPPVSRDRSLGMDPAIKKFRQNEYDTAIRIQEERGVTLSRSPGRQGPIGSTTTARAYDAVGGFPREHFDRQWPNLRDRIRDHLDKADFVPVDVSTFSAEQRIIVMDYIKDMGPRVFIVGG